MTDRISKILLKNEQIAADRGNMLQTNAQLRANSIALVNRANSLFGK